MVKKHVNAQGFSMNMLTLYILLTACLVCVTTALPGIFLVLQGIPLIADAISHAILPGIVIMFLITGNLESPLLFVGSCIAGLVTVFCIQFFINKTTVKQDAVLSLVFPAFFSLGVILISLYARNTHLDTDMVLLGEIAFTPFNRLILFDIDFGPVALWTLSALLLFNGVAISLFYKELILVSFDPVYSRTLGFNPTILLYLLMTLTTLTCVGSFDCVGSLMTIALMITPACSAFLLAKTVREMIELTVCISICSSLIGYALAHFCDISIAGSITTVQGIIFAGCTAFSKKSPQ